MHQWTEIWRFWMPVPGLMLLEWYLWFGWIHYPAGEGCSCREWCCHEWVYLASNHFMVTSKCQNNININHTMNGCKMTEASCQNEANAFISIAKWRWCVTNYGPSVVMCSRTQTSISLTSLQLHNCIWSVKYKYEVCQQNLLCHIIYGVSPREELLELSVYSSQWIYHIVSDTIKV